MFAADLHAAFFNGRQNDRRFFVPSDLKQKCPRRLRGRQSREFLLAHHCQRIAMDDSCRPRTGRPAQAKQRRREQDQKDDEQLLRLAIKARDKKRVMNAMRKLGASAESVARVEKLWAKLPPK